MSESAERRHLWGWLGQKGSSECVFKRARLCVCVCGFPAPVDRRGWSEWRWLRLGAEWSAHLRMRAGERSRAELQHTHGAQGGTRATLSPHLKLKWSLNRRTRERSFFFFFFLPYPQSSFCTRNNEKWLRCGPDSSFPTRLILGETDLFLLILRFFCWCAWRGESLALRGRRRLFAAAAAEIHLLPNEPSPYERKTKLKKQKSDLKMQHLSDFCPSLIAHNQVQLQPACALHPTNWVTSRKSAAATF